MKTSLSLDLFERAFSAGSCSSSLRCHCGKLYYHDSARDWGWSPEELEDLQKDPQAVGLEFAPSSLIFEGKEYVDACSCWHPKGEACMAFLFRHRKEVAKFYEFLKSAQQSLADSIPVIQP